MGQPLFFNRDLSWLSFNERVLLEAADGSVPLMERMRFLSIFSSNLDEFYRVRMPVVSLDRSLYDEAIKTVSRQQEMLGHILREELLPALAQQQIFLVYGHNIPAEIAEFVTDYFFSAVAAFVHPIEVTADTDFLPENNQLYCVVTLAGKQLFMVRVPVDTLGRFLKIKQDGKTWFVFLEDVIRMHVEVVFRTGEVKGCYNVKINRNAELNIKDEYGTDIADEMERLLADRDKGWATRLLFEKGMPHEVIYTLAKSLNLMTASTVEGGLYHNLKDLSQLNITTPGSEYDKWEPLPAVGMAIPSLYGQVAERDIIIHTPYQSYNTVLRFFNEAAIDPDTEEIFTTLYRVATDSRIIRALMSAAMNGKKVTVLVELKARFDEANNIKWSKQMKAAGIKTIYSSNKLKVHAKIALVKRRGQKMPLLGLLATGNLNETTARFYTDHILLTAHQPLLEELALLSDFLKKQKKPGDDDTINFDHLLVARFNLLDKFLWLIDREIKHAALGLKSEIIIKVNNLEEEKLIAKLYEASQAGVKIRMIVRSICRLVPGIHGMSENITVRRIVDRYLEHGRVFVFENAGTPEVYLGSADWMERNIHRRIEVCFPVYDELAKQQVVDLLQIQLADNTCAVAINDRMDNARITAEADETAIRAQKSIYEYCMNMAAKVPAIDIL